jgi:hypothetical protein
VLAEQPAIRLVTSWPSNKAYNPAVCRTADSAVAIAFMIALKAFVATTVLQRCNPMQAIRHLLLVIYHLHQFQFIRWLNAQLSERKPKVIPWSPSGHPRCHTSIHLRCGQLGREVGQTSSIKLVLEQIHHEPVLDVAFNALTVFQGRDRTGDVVSLWLNLAP